MKALITAYARSPFHFARKGALAGMRPDTLAAQVVTGLLQRTGIDPSTLEDVIAGCAYPEAAQGNNIARIVSLLAGLPQELGGMTVNRFCGSSMSAIHIAAAQIEAGLGEAYLCIGVESMTMVPQGGFNFSPHPALYEHSDAYISMGETAENVAQRYAVTRADQEALAVASHRKAAAARDAGRLQAEIVPITLASGDMVAQDGCIRPGTTPEALAALRPAFRDDGVVTAGTSSPLTDGAVAVLVTTEAYATRHGLAPLARIVGHAGHAQAPNLFTTAPVSAIQRLLARIEWSLETVDLFEINEAFAVVPMVAMRELGIDHGKLNINGGACALGHPIGASGARILVTLLAALKQRGLKRGVASVCIGGGEATAVALELWQE